MTTLMLDTTIMTGLLEEAIEFCSRKTGLKDREMVLEAMRNGDCSVCEYLRYGLAGKMAEYLGSVDDTVRAVYTYEPEYATGVEGTFARESARLPGINLIVWASRKNAALSSVVASVRSGLIGEYRQLGCPRANALCYEIDVEVTDDDEVQRRTGYGALISSLYVRPIEVWRR